MSRYSTLPILACLLLIAGYGLLASLLVGRQAEELPDHDAEAIQACAACLPPEVTLATRFAREMPNVAPVARERMINCGILPQETAMPVSEVTSVRRSLINLGASCRDGAIVAEDGKPVFFYTPVSEFVADTGRCLNLSHRLRLRDRDFMETVELLKQGHVVVLHPAFARDADYHKRAAAQESQLNQSAPGTAAPRP